ncbi:LOW QUALITY PROTEIN: pre-B-cell leukemia homeobox interacting protein 1b [Sphaeramia orbicularis]|uniref:LOW QUALITY PROTEIN: pre-B-cell leukemia homeobox interacting protein 1b n=1 Tax=Sphaeramia orbicularis TaxID=375764 RepID=UPI00117D4081|nr:LOW QUALITY PROTEIN: pre-B-cell leukemia transcription factor-interacting protein 1 [Sphaeramia orbicularis]
MSGGSGTNNSWTILTSEETVAETLRPVAGGTEHHEGSHTSAAEGAVPSEGLPAEDHLLLEEKTTEPSGDKDVHKVAASSIPDIPVPTSLEVMSSCVPDSGSRSDKPPEATAQTNADPDSFSDSYTHISPSPDESPASPLSTETLGGLESIQEEERLTQEGTQHPVDGEELQQEEDESELSQGMTDLGKVADSPVDSEAGEERLETKGEEGEEVRRRRPLLAALERIGRTEEEEDEEEEFQVPQREEDSGLSLNKCILGAVILLGLGTIFFSGVFMDLDDESDYGARGLKDSEAPGKQDWLNPDVPPPAADADNTELLNKLAEGNQHITELQAQLQAQKEELKVAKGQAAEGAKERLQWEEVEKENSRLKKMMASLPVLQKENERMKRELESVPALQKELERLTSTVTELKLSSAAEAPVKAATSPSSGQIEHSRHSTADPAEKQARKPWNEQKEGKKKDWKKDKYDMGEKKEWREGENLNGKERKARKDGSKAEGKEKEWKKGKTEQGRFDKEKEGKQKKHSEEPKQWKGKEKEWKKDKASRGDEGKPWKDREGKNERMEKSEKDWKKSKHDKLNEGKEWRDKEQRKEWKSGKDHGEWQKSKDEWRGEKEWKKAKDGFKDSGKEKYEKKDQKEKGEKKEWKKDGDWKSKNGKDNSKEWKGQGERKHESKNHDKEWKEKDERRQWSSESKTGKDEKEWKRKDERKQRGNDKRLGEEGWKEKKHNAEWKKDKSSFRKHTEELKNSGDHDHHDHDEEHLWGERKPPHSHRRPSPNQPEYWVHKRDRLQHSTRPQQTCASTEACAQADRVRLVHLTEFQTTLQTYLSKAEEAGVDSSTTDELRRLAAEFFKDGLFVHDQMSFQDYVEDIGDILEDMVEENENEEEEDSAIEDEMEGFELEVMQKFSVPGAGEEEKIKGEWRKESVRGRG